MSASLGLPRRGRGRWAGGTYAGRRRRTGWLLVAPAVAALAAVGLFPLVYSLTLSFRQWDLQTPAHPFLGLDNYAQALTDARIWGALQNTLIVVGVGVALQFALGLGLALVMVDELRGKRFVLPLLMLPVMMVPVVVAFTWRLLWDTRYGAINQVLGSLLGREVAIAWLAERPTALFAMVVTEVWQWTPFMFLVLLAGLSNLNPELYDAAALDGAGWWSALRDVTLPGLAPVIAVALLFRALDAFKIFDLVFIFTQGGPGTATESLSWYVYQLGFKFFRMGYAAAVSYLILIGLTVAASLYVGRFVREERA